MLCDFLTVISWYTLKQKISSLIFSNTKLKIFFVSYFHIEWLFHSTLEFWLYIGPTPISFTFFPLKPMVLFRRLHLLISVFWDFSPYHSEIFNYLHSTKMFCYIYWRFNDKILTFCLRKVWYDFTTFYHRIFPVPQRANILGAIGSHICKFYWMFNQIL